ncbi:magnesium transporter NIPA-domain-containing protein [Irpex rosettiformis]|uniref:Magnesium transporter NIPA-domain-containing protein n=1 Tax=Irpex rosettiformis TaxID=378272 RepID=A0ACB8UFP2_9APHY|nr:magnesium transporter NIPA-domain-containing protein [Irpex rosettiformis]
MSSTTTSPSASASASGQLKAPGSLKVVGIILAIVSGVLIGSSFVFKKKGLIQSQARAGEGVSYLKSWLWWTGMIMMIAGELCNFAAYAFVEAIVVTPMGALSVVISAILSAWFLQEKLSMFGWLGCALCIIGSVVIALNGPSEQSIGQIVQFQHMFLAPGFLVWISVLIASALVIIFYFAPKYGKKNILWYIMVCSMIGGISVSVTTGLGAAIVTSVQGDNQFKHWFIYFLLVFIIATLVTEVYYLNVALALFNTAMVTPTYYVIFTFFSIITTIVLFKGLSAPPSQIITLVMGFLVISVGIAVLQLSKIDPTNLKSMRGLDRRSTMLLQATQVHTAGVDEKDLAALEDPGIDTLRGSFGAMGSIIRARTAKRMSMSTGHGGSFRSRHGDQANTGELPHYNAMGGHGDHFNGMKRHQLYDPPVPTTQSPAPMSPKAMSAEELSLRSQPSPRQSERKMPTIKFGDEDIVHSYPVTGHDGNATHEHRSALHGLPAGAAAPYPPIFGQSATISPIGALLDADSLRSAPPTVYVDPYRSPTMNPFENSPQTTTAMTFPKYANSTSSLSTSTTGATIGTGIRDSLVEDRTSQGQGHGHLDRLFGRSNSSSGVRKYPKGDSMDDKEESMSLVHRPSEESIESVESLPSIIPQGNSIRLVRSNGSDDDHSGLR